MPPVSWPIASIFCAWRSSASTRFSRVMSSVRAEQQTRPTAQRAQLRQADARPGDRPREGDVARLDAEIRTGPADRIAQQFPVVDVRQLADGPPGDLFGIGTEHAAECRVRLHDALAVVLGQQDAEWTFLEDAAETLFALP